MNTRQFEHGYFNTLSDFVADLLPKETFVKYLMKSTNDMVQNPGLRTNREVFLESFGAFVGMDAVDLYEQRFYDYYAGPFNQLREVVSPVETIIADVASLKEKGYTLVIATNPLFPMSAVESRIRWAGLDPQDFVYISSFEENKFCKPQLGFYEEILKKLDLEASHCLMVGNDVEEDLVTQKLGFETYLISNHKIQRSDIAFIPDHEGDYNAFHSFVEGLPEVKGESK
jgi:FMN phosphatase YigB (HAD superfamily)